MANITQKIIDKECQSLIESWAGMVDCSGLTQTVFIACGHGTMFLYRYDRLRKEVISKGFLMPELVKGVDITEFN